MVGVTLPLVGVGTAQAENVLGIVTGSGNYVYIYMYIYICMGIYIYQYEYTHVYIHMGKYVCIYLCGFAGVFTYIHGLQEARRW